MNKGLLTVVILAGVGLMSGIVWFAGRGDTALKQGVNQDSTSQTKIGNTNQTQSDNKNATIVPIVHWEDRGNGYEPIGTPPSCPDPLVLTTPVDLSKVYSILYPGQVRGEYKPHGGFRFDGYRSEDITVRAPLDAYIIEGARYFENTGAEQILLTFLNPCGVMYRFDHLVDVTPEIKAFIDTLPPAQPNDSRTTRVDPPIPVKAGEIIATSVGAGTNVFVDFGVYDLRQENLSSSDPRWKAAHPSDFERHGVCWFGLLNKADEAVVRGKPGSGSSGSTSDYCT